MELKNKSLLKELSNLQDASPELVKKAERQLSFDGTNTFRKGCTTMFLSSDVKVQKAVIRGNAVEYPVFAVAYFDDKNQHIGCGTVSINALARRYYPNQGEQTNPVNAIENFEKFGKTAIEIVENCIDNNLGVVYTETKGYYIPVWDATANNGNGKMDFSDMTKADRNLFRIEEAAPEIVKFMEK